MVFATVPAAGPAFHGTFEVGKILGETFSTYFSNVIPFLLLSALALSPLLLFTAWVSTLPLTDPKTALIRSLTNVIQLLCTPFATATITYGVYQQMRGFSPSLGTCLSCFADGSRSLHPTSGTASAPSP